MAMTASLYVNYSSVNPGTPVNVHVVVSNSGGDDVNVTSFRPQVPVGSSATFGTVSPATPATVPAGGSLGFGFSVCGFAPQREDDPQAAYDVTATIVCSDGSVVTPTAATVQVSSPFDLMPEPGALRFDSNLNSYAIALL
jgi:hypothetical protein